MALERAKFPSRTNLNPPLYYVVQSWKPVPNHLRGQAMEVTTVAKEVDKGRVEASRHMTTNDEQRCQSAQTLHVVLSKP